MWWWQSRGGVEAKRVASKDEVVGGEPGVFFVSDDGLRFHLRCPCGRCDKHNILPLSPSRGDYVWDLGGTRDKPTLSPSIHWFEKDGVRTHWHGWLRDGVYEG